MYHGHNACIMSYMAQFPRAHEGSSSEGSGGASALRAAAGFGVLQALQGVGSLSKAGGPPWEGWFEPERLGGIQAGSGLGGSPFPPSPLGLLKFRGRGPCKTEDLTWVRVGNSLTPTRSWGLLFY